jgi:hypothetical protein
MPLEVLQIILNSNNNITTYKEFFVCLETDLCSIQWHSYDILGARMLWKPKEARILKNLKKIYRSTSVIW